MDSTDGGLGDPGVDWSVEISPSDIDPDETERFLNSVLADLDDKKGSPQPHFPLPLPIENASHDELGLELNLPSRQNSEESINAQHGRKHYRCRRCGVPRRGHTCVGYVAPTEKRKRGRPDAPKEEQRASFFIQLVLLWWNRLKGMRCGSVD